MYMLHCYKHAVLFHATNKLFVVVVVVRMHISAEQGPRGSPLRLPSRNLQHEQYLAGPQTARDSSATAKLP